MFLINSFDFISVIIFDAPGVAEFVIYHSPELLSLANDSFSGSAGIVTESIIVTPSVSTIAVNSPLELSLKLACKSP